MRSAATIAIAGLLAAAALPPALAQSPHTGGWVGDAKTGCKVWNPHPEPSEMILWSGACLDGVADGPGKLQWFKAGKSTATEINEGTWQKGHQVGRGTQVWPAGRYEGDVLDGLPHGQGVLTLQNARYDGEFLNGKANGAGTLTRGDKSTQGAWKDGCFNDGKTKASIGVPVESCQ